VFNIELFHDDEVIDAILDRFDLTAGLNPNDPDFDRKKMIFLNRFCGLDYVRVRLNAPLSFIRHTVEDTAILKRSSGREYQDEHSGPIMSWEDFEKYSWPNPLSDKAAEDLEWYQKNLPEEMCIMGGYTAHICEELTWLMGYETFCSALFEQRDLVQAIADRLLAHYKLCIKRYLDFDRVKIIWATDDMGYKGGLLFSPQDMRDLVLSTHKILAEMAHAAGRPYLFHSCGNLHAIMDDLIKDVKIDGKHSFEDTIESICDAKHLYGQQIAVLGGMDVDFLCRAQESEIRKRVQDTVNACQPGGGFCLGTGNTVANYIPLDSYLTMVDESRLYLS
jgi:uroporphyrinogen decarboxylase